MGSDNETYQMPINKYLEMVLTNYIYRLSDEQFEKQMDNMVTYHTPATKIYIKEMGEMLIRLSEKEAK